MSVILEWPFVLPAVASIVTLSAGIIRTRETWPWPVGVWIALVGVATVPLGTSFAWKVHPAFGFTYGICTYLPALAMCLSMFDVLKKSVDMALIVPALVTAAIAVIIVIPTGVIPYYRVATTNTEITSDLQEGLNISFVEDSLARITDSLDVAATNIETEQRSVRTEIERLLDSIKERNKSLKTLRRQQQQLLLEVEQYRALASLSEQQASAVRAALARGKYVDYGIGFILGLASSAIVTFGARFVAGWHNRRG